METIYQALQLLATDRFPHWRGMKVIREIGRLGRLEGELGGDVGVDCLKRFAVGS